MDLTVKEMTQFLHQQNKEPSFFKTRVPTQVYIPRHRVLSPLINRLEDRFLQSSAEGLSFEDFNRQLDKYKEISVPAPHEKTKHELIREWKRELLHHGAVKPLVKFRRAVKSVLVLLRAIDRSSYLGDAQTPSVLSWVQIHNDLAFNKRGAKKDGLLFDPSEYRAQRERQLSSEAKAILSMDPSLRTKEQLHVALVALNQSVEAFSEFPIKMQESLVRVGFFEHFEAKRVIIRQGHYADNFYLMLSGMAIVTILETDQHGTENVRTAAFLKKGNSFGELALMHGSLRSATVTCKDSVELLAVGREDFINIFMHVERNKVPEHIQFLKEIDVFRGWPINKIPYSDPNICIFTYFRKGVLLCKNSNLAEWIYIIRTGACKVLKAVKVQDPDNSQSGKPRSAPQFDRTHQGPPYLMPSRKQVPKKPRLKRKPNVTLKSKEKDTESLTCHLKTLDRIYLERHSEKHLTEDREMDEWEKSLSDAAQEQRSEVLICTDDHKKTKQACTSKNSIDTNLHTSEILNPELSCDTNSDICSSNSSINDHNKQNRNNSLNGTIVDHHRESERQTDTQTANSPTSDVNSNMVFVQVTKLGPKDVFGLEKPVLSAMTPTTSLSLVSEGAECVLINRRFFMENLPEIQLKRLRLTLQPYPTEEVLRRKLIDQRKWKAYKNMALNDHLTFTRHLQETLSLFY